MSISLVDDATSDGNVEGTENNCVHLSTPALALLLLKTSLMMSRASASCYLGTSDLRYTFPMLH